MASSSVASKVLRRLEGKVAIITGAASGIGEATARLFTKHGATVVVTDIQDEKAKKVCEDLGSSTSFIHCDVTKEADLENVVNTTITKYGKLDVMFNNAGICDEKPQPNILDNDLSEFKKVIDVNLIGQFLGTKHATRVMIPHRRGTIINTASVCSSLGGVAPHSYTSSKHAILGLTRNTAVELGQHGIRVNCVSPYFVVTPLAISFMNSIQKDIGDVYSNLKGVLLYPEDVAESVLYLASDEAKYVSGHNLVVDGGFSIVNPKFSMFEG